MIIMKRVTLTLALLALMVMAVTAQTTATTQVSNLTKLENDIKLQEDLVLDMQDSIAILDSDIAFYKGKLDSANAVVKALKEQIKDLERLKKEQEKGIKLANKTRQATVEDRDELIYKEEIVPVLDNQYDKLEVEQALAKFDAMETKDVIKRKDLVQNYGKYSQEIREMLEKQKRNFEQLRWATQGSDSEPYKDFQKAFKKLGYYKTFEKGQKNATTPTIPYLDEVMSNIQLLMRQGFNSQYQYNNVLNMLY